MTSLDGAILAGEGVRFVTFPNLAVRHGFSTRLGGVSEGPYASLNIGTSTDDAPERVQENRDRLGRATGVPLVRILSMVHGNGVVRVDRSHPPVREGDACITDRPGVPMMLTTADCVPIFFHDPVRRAVGLAHAGWRGTVADVAGETVRAMAREFGCRPQDLQVAVGPAIGPCCFEVHEDVAGPFRRRFPGKDLVAEGVNKFTVDLWRANREVLLEAGVSEAGIRICRVCTSCREDLFFSFRRDRGVTGRMAALVALE